MTDRALRLTLKNYRAFDHGRPVQWLIDDQFRAFVGINNSGKSSLLRFFHEIRQRLLVLGQAPTQNPSQQITFGTPTPIGFTSVADQQEVFCNRNDHDMLAEFALIDPSEADGGLEPTKVVMRWRRADAALTVAFEARGAVTHAAQFSGANPVINLNGTETSLDVTRYVSAFAFNDLAASLYLGPFRNAVNTCSTYCPPSRLGSR